MPKSCSHSTSQPCVAQRAHQRSWMAVSACAVLLLCTALAQPFNDIQKRTVHERWGAPEVGKGAWVFVAAIGDLNRHYYDLLLSSMQCLQATNSKYEMVLLYEGQITPEVQVAFRALNVSKLYRYPHYFNNKKIDISALEEKSRPAREQNHFWHKCWNKLAAWTLSKYEKIVVMDPDIIAWENADELFEYPELSAVPDYGFQVTRRDHLDTFNSGFMVVQPNMKTFKHMTELLNSYTSWFVDQGFLNDYFKYNWRNLPLAYQLWPGIVSHGIPGIVNASVVKFVHHVSESACWECDLGWKTREACAKHVCPQCCERVVQCREDAYARIAQYKKDNNIDMPFTHGIHSNTKS